VIVGVPKESYPGERRVALVPAVIPMLAKAGLEVVVESGAGEGAGYPDAAYVEKGGKFSRPPLRICRRRHHRSSPLLRLQ